MQKGIVVAGHLCVDVLKEVAYIPKAHELAEIRSIDVALGGLVNNCARSLARLDPELPVRTCGLIGTDGYGDTVLRELGRYKNIDTGLLSREGLTAFSDVLTDARTRERAFLTFAGSAAKFCEEHVPVDQLDCSIFHAGYILLLDALDQLDDEYGTRMARLLKRVQDRGILTSIDVVTDTKGRFRELMPPAIRYADIVCINEYEAGATVGIPLRGDGDALIADNIPKVLARLKDMGARRWVAIHAPEGGFGIDEHGKYHAVPGAVAPKGYIAGTVGAGDAFTSGLLLGAYRGVPMAEALEYATASAICSLSAADACKGVVPLDEALEKLKTFERRAL